MELKPGQACNRCNKVIEGVYSTCYNKDGEVVETICDGCRNAEMMKDYNESKYISTKLMMEASMAKFYWEEGDFNRLRKEVASFIILNKKPLLEIANVVEKIQTLIHDFEDKHWAPYMRKYWNDSTDRGHNYEISDMKIMMWGSAGRVLVTAENKEGSVTMIFSDEAQSEESIEKWGRMRGGIQGISSTGDNALKIMDTLLKMDKIEFKTDKNVRLAGL